MTRRARLPEGAAAVLRRDRRALARLITQVENRDPAALPVLRALYPRTGRARVIGVTGPLGVGKSSLVNAWIRLLRSRGVRVGVIGVDPSSPFSGGSVLGDRIRIDREAGDDGVFFRSMASRGYAGGIAAATREVARLLDAFGMDVVLVETVGSGQVDVEIRRVASTSVVVLVPHLGDEVQSLKAGLFEIADVFCINKSDLPGAEHAERYLTELVQSGPARPNEWVPRVVRTSALGPSGLEELVAAVDAHESFLDASGHRAEIARRNTEAEVGDLVRERLGARVDQLLQEDPRVRRVIGQVLAREIDPIAAAERLLGELRDRL